jgi:hypothetical protein
MSIEKEDVVNALKVLATMLKYAKLNTHDVAELMITELARQHLILDVRNQKGERDKYYGVEIRHMINRFSKRKKLVGSYTERVLIISRKHYPAWKEFIITIKNQINKLPDVYDLQEQDIKNIARHGQSNNQ